MCKVTASPPFDYHDNVTGAGVYIVYPGVTLPI